MPNDNNKFNDPQKMTNPGTTIATGAKKINTKMKTTAKTATRTKTETTTYTSYTQHHAAALVPHGTVYEDALSSEDGYGDG